jgi:hypothetical protein
MQNSLSATSYSKSSSERAFKKCRKSLDQQQDILVAGFGDNLNTEDENIFFQDVPNFAPCSGESKEELISAAMDIVEGVVLRSANNITDELKASYEKDIYSEVVYTECIKGIAELDMGLRIERTVVIPIKGLGRIAGSLKVPFAFYTKSGRVLLLLDVKTKKTVLKESDMENLGCAVEQTALCSGGERPRAMLLNFCSGVHSSMVMQCDGTISN